MQRPIFLFSIFFNWDTPCTIRLSPSLSCFGMIYKFHKDGVLRMVLPGSSSLPALICRISIDIMRKAIFMLETSDGKVYKSLITLERLESTLGDSFLKVHRSRLVSVMAIHDITDKVNLNNGERLGYVARRKKELTAALAEKRARLIGTLDSETPPVPDDELHAQYRCFDALPIAFTDIEMVLDEDKNAVDWIFRYANPALARLEKVPLHELLGRSFRSVFPNMDSKWLKSYERAALYGETLELIDHSPEIDTYLKIICFPTQPGHCGCLLFDIAEMKFAEDSGDAHNAKLRYFPECWQNCSDCCICSRK